MQKQRLWLRTIDVKRSEFGTYPRSSWHTPAASTLSGLGKELRIAQKGNRNGLVLLVKRIGESTQDAFRWNSRL